MSFDLAVWHPSRRMTNREALEVYKRLCAGDRSGVEDSPAVDSFYKELVAIHPEIDDVPDDKIDDSDYCPWSVAHDRSPGHVVMCCVWSKAEYCAALIERLARKHGLAMFDPQGSIIVYPDAGANGHQTKPRKPWWKFW
ncbi:MAG: hypothetical protein PHU85_02420 [Phycisphaerae bacterium]|nr:hypothetical protein [Phycisphaerae bacterium]